MKKWLFIFIFLILGVAWVMPTLAIDCSPSETDYNKLELCKNDLVREVDLLVARIKPNEDEIKKLDNRIKLLQSSINVAVSKQKELVKEVAKRETLVAEHYVLFSKKTRELYKKMRARTLMTAILSAVGTGQGQREIVYANTAGDQDRQLILGLSTEILKLEEDKKNLEEQKNRLSTLKMAVDKQAAALKEVVSKANIYKNELLGKIAALSAKQQEILNEKQGTFSTTVGDVPLADDPNSRPDYPDKNPLGFSPAFAAFSFGAPHFKGMSQYGAYGRAKSGQAVETILRAYYGGVEIKKDYDAGKQIGVSGYGRMDTETYVKRIYEVPNAWGDNGGFEALKAQAVAARSYALAWTDEGKGGAICTTEACQVYKNSNKGGKWEEAVNATRGWVLWANGKPLKAWYASTAGGYIQGYTDTYSGYATPGFWDTANGRSGWTSQAYEKTAESPWFYKGWYKSRSGDSCGRGHPWLNGEEMADILNAWVVIYQQGQNDDRVVPIDYYSCFKKSANPYTLSELKGKGGYSSVSGVSVTYSDGGYTSNVTFSTNKGDVTIKGSEFKDAFNLRAPGRIALKSGLFNIEKK